MKTLAVHSMKHSLLDELKPHHLDELLRNAEEVEFAAGQVIFREGEPANRFYLIQSGKVVVEARSRGAAPIHIETLVAGDVLGWSWLFPGFAWHFQARALETTRAIACDGAHLLVHSEEDHDFGYELMKRVAQVVIRRLQETRKQLVQIEQS
jgi:CRP-like cAMP-binding protein